MTTPQFGGAEDIAHPTENSPNGLVKELLAAPVETPTSADDVDEYAYAAAAGAPDAEESIPVEDSTADPDRATNAAGNSEGSEESEAEGPVKTKRRHQLDARVDLRCAARVGAAGGTGGRVSEMAGRHDPGH